MKSNDLISRKYVIKELLKEREHYPPMVAERYSFGVKMPHSFNQAMRGGIRKALRIAETAPVADAELMRHGYWIPQDNTYTKFMCSDCKGRNHDSSGKYCSECGCKMDAEVNNDGSNSAEY